MVVISIFQSCISFNMVIITSIATKAVILMSYQYIIQSSLLNWQLHHITRNDRKDYKESSVWRLQNRSDISYCIMHYVLHIVMICNDDVWYDFAKLNTIQYPITRTSWKPLTEIELFKLFSCNWYSQRINDENCRKTNMVLLMWNQGDYIRLYGPF